MSPESTRRGFLALAGSAAVAGCGGLSPGGGGSPDPIPAASTPAVWAGPRADGQNANAVPGAATPGTQPSLSWTWTPGSVVVGADVLFVRAEKGMTGVHRTDGRQVFYEQLAETAGVFALSAETVLVPTSEALVAYGRDSDDEEWRTTVDVPLGGAPAVAGGRAYLTTPGGVAALARAADGAEWTTEFDYPAFAETAVAGSPAVGGGHVAVTSTATYPAGGSASAQPRHATVLHVLEAETGEVTARHSLTGRPQSPVAFDGGFAVPTAVYGPEGPVGGFVHLVDGSGRLHGRRTFPGTTVRDVAVVDDTAYVATGGGVHAFTPDEYSAWQTDVPGVTSMVATGDALLVGTEDGLAALRREDGTERWTVGATADGPGETRAVAAVDAAVLARVEQPDGAELRWYA